MSMRSKETEITKKTKQSEEKIIRSIKDRINFVRILTTFLSKKENVIVNQ